VTWPGIVETARAVADGRRSAEAVTQAALDEIRARGSAINAFTAVFADRALADARQLDAAIAEGSAPGSLAGVPFAVKNLFDVEGVTTLAGSKILAGAPPAATDAALVSRLRRAGAILLGTLNMDEFAYGFVTENAHYGPTHNPHDLSRIAGGSSGGSAAAVAARLAPLTLGSDTNGSIRVPASLCGVFGLKPSFGRLPVAGAYPFAESLDHTGLFARSVEDLALAYDVCGNDPASAISHQLAALEAAPLRAGLLEGWFTQGASGEVLAAQAAVGEALQARAGVRLAGAQIARSAAFCLTAHEGARLHLSELAERLDEFDPAVGDRLLAGALAPDAIYRAAMAYRDRFRAEANALFEQFDVLIAPSTPCPAPKIGQSTMWLDGMEVSVRKNLGAYTQPISYIGLPVLAAPVSRPGLLPIGVQLIAASGREDLVFAAALRLERAGVIAFHAPGPPG
jgi:aspartyl-tRNA(Asn)/glutamyl-tRNA(Gln) amidotransferase subunit A